MRRTLPVSPVIGAALVVLSALLAAPAGAHIQVSPSIAAPNDSVRFTLLVPGERQQETRRVEVKVPRGVLPFAFAETPGWRRRAIPAADGGVDRIVWSGRLAADGFAEFSFLAGTPEQPGTLSWKAIQVYSDGKVVRWIGPPGSEEPAPTTRLVAGLVRQNAGGESGGGRRAAPTIAAAGDGPGAGPDWLARSLAAAGLVAAIAALVLSLRRRRGT